MSNVFQRAIKRFILFIVFLTLCITITATTVIVGNGYITYHNAIKDEPLEIAMQNIRNQADYVPLSEVTPLYIDAVIAIEDHRFYKHHGIDARALLRAVKTNLLTKSYAEGGSTITQQLAKNLYFSQEKTINRKVAEVFLANQLERSYSKEDILSAYINTIYFGNGYYGIYKASIGYYNVLPADLSKAQATLLAGVPNAPSIYAPNANPELAQERQQQVLDAMVKYHFLSDVDAEQIKQSS